MTRDSKPGSSRYASIAAWNALQGQSDADPAKILEQAAKILGQAAASLAAELDQLARSPMPGKQARPIAEARLLLAMVAELFGQTETLPKDEGALAFRAYLQRHRGRPRGSAIDRGVFTRRDIAKEVREFVLADDLQKTAVGKVASARQLTDKMVADCYREWRPIFERDEELWKALG